MYSFLFFPMMNVFNAYKKSSLFYVAKCWFRLDQTDFIVHLSENLSLSSPKVQQRYIQYA